jgi:hypothetical protein
MEICGPCASPSVLLCDTLTLHSELFEPLHLPQSQSFQALKKWRWANGLERLLELAGNANVEVCCLQVIMLHY